MDGEFLCEETFGTVKGVGGGTHPARPRRGGGAGGGRGGRRAMRAVPGVDPAVPGRDRPQRLKVGSKYKG